MLRRFLAALRRLAQPTLPAFEVRQVMGNFTFHVAHVPGYGYLAFETFEQGGETTEVRGSFAGDLTREEARAELVRWASPEAVQAFDRCRNACLGDPTPVPC